MRSHVLLAEPTASSSSEGDFGADSTTDVISFMPNHPCDTPSYATHTTSLATRVSIPRAAPSSTASGGRHSKPTSNGSSRLATSAKFVKRLRSDFRPLSPRPRHFSAKRISILCSCRPQEDLGIWYRHDAHFQHGPSGARCARRPAARSAPSYSRRFCAGGEQWRRSSLTTAPLMSQRSTGSQTSSASDTSAYRRTIPRRTASSKDSTVRFATPSSRHAKAKTPDGRRSHPLHSGQIAPPLASRPAIPPSTCCTVWNPFFLLTSYRRPSSFPTSPSHSRPKISSPSAPANSKSALPTLPPSTTAS